MAEYVETRPVTAAPPRVGMLTISPATAVINVLLFAGRIGMLLPFVWMIFSSLKAQFEVLSNPPTLVPLAWHLETYADAWTRAPFGRFYLNTVIVAVTTTLSALLFGTMAGFGFAKHRF